MCVFNVRKLFNLSQNSLTMNWPNFECNSDVPELWKVSVEREFPDLIVLKLFMLGSTPLSSSQSSKLKQIKKLPKHDIGTCCKISIPTSPNFKWVIRSQNCVYYKDQSHLTRFVLNIFQGLVSFNSMWVLCVCALWIFFQFSPPLFFLILIPVHVNKTSGCITSFHLVS